MVLYFEDSILKALCFALEVTSVLMIFASRGKELLKKNYF